MTLLREIEADLGATGMPWTKFGRIVAGDPRLINDMRNGRQPRAAMVDKIRAFLTAGASGPA